jgi:hypothetical protein
MPLGDRHEPTALEVRYFGLLLAASLGLVSALAWWRWRVPVAAWLFGCLALVVAVTYYALPPLRRPLLLAWRAALRPAQGTVSYLALAIVYFLVFTPVGLILRVMGRDPLERRFEPMVRSYFVRRRTARDSARYFRQF